MTTEAPETRVRVWDIYLRLFHWALVCAVTVSFLSIQFDAMQIHTTSGICVVGLLVFRIIWGIVGSTTARFRQFVRGPKTVLAYIKSETAAPKVSSRVSDARPTQVVHPGHSPIGALSVVGMLTVLSVQIASGMFADDEVYTTGPLAQFVSLDFSEAATAIHGINAKITAGLIILHLIAIAFYFFVRKSNLILPMLTGDKSYPANLAVEYRKLHMGGLIAALSTIALALAVSIWLYSL